MFIPLPKKAYDLSGRQFGLLTAVGPVGIKRYKSGPIVVWQCACACGRQTETVAQKLVSGWVKSCGCLRLAAARDACTTHGLTKAPEYRVWTHLKGRCLNPKDKSFANYGGRGVTVCAEWESSFAAFLRDMGPRPSPKHSIDRIDVNAGYYPGNCRWVTADVQQNNRRNNRVLTRDGSSLTLAQWARRLNIQESTIERRLARGLSDAESLVLPRRRLA